ncbi:MAG: hypothetical protein ACRDA3_11870 [Peptostreptococcaceae bacterium]
MRNKLLVDIIVYILSPILVLSFVDDAITKFFIAILILGIVLYTIMVKSKEKRINLSGIMFSVICIMFFSLKQTIQSNYEIYVYNTYFLIVGSIIINAFSLLNKNIIKQVYIDFLKCKGWSELNIWNVLKKAQYPYYFNKMSSIISIHILTIALIRVYSMYNYGTGGYTTTTDLQILASVLFVIGELYIISKIANTPKPKNDGISQNKNIKNNVSSKRVINLNQYKNMNK